MHSSHKNLALEGLRGVASLVVVASHLALTFWPALHGEPGGTSKATWPEVVFHSPLSFVYGGFFAVAVFFVMSGYVLTFEYARTGNDDALRAMMIKRYPRLMPPVFATALITFGCMKFGLLLNNEVMPSSWIASLYRFEPNLGVALREGLWGSLLLGECQYNPPAWSMRIELLGSLALLALVLVTKNFRPRSLFFAMAALALVASTGVFATYWLSFLAGVWIAARPARVLSAYAAVPLLLLGLWLGGFHSTSRVHSVLDIIPYTPTIAAVAVFLVVLEWPVAERALRRCAPLGRLSFSIYLLHMLILSCVGLRVYRVVGAGGEMERAAWVASACTLGVSVACAWAFSKFVDSPSIRLSRWFAEVTHRSPNDAERRSTLQPQGAEKPRQSV